MDLGEYKLKVIFAFAGIGAGSVINRALVSFDPSYAVFSIIGNVLIYLVQVISANNDVVAKKSEFKYWTARVLLGSILSIFLTKIIADKTGMNDILVAIGIGLFCENIKELMEIFKKVGLSAWRTFLEKTLNSKKDGQD
jgi:hypothetical protein